MSTPPIDAPRSLGSVTMRLRGGVSAPRRARRSVLSELQGSVADQRASDAALIVSELVTNSVLHANVGSRQSLTVELATLDDRLRIAVIDPGSLLEPQLVPRGRRTSGGLGLFLVDELSAAWGFTRDGIGTTCVWCDLLFDPSSAGH